MGLEAQEILDNTAEWTERLYDKNDDEIEEYLQSQGKDCNKILYIEYHYYQIGETEAWLQKMSAAIGDPLVVRRELLLQRLHGSSLSPFPQEDIEYIVETERKPIDELWILDYYKFDIYKKLDKRIPYLVGVDCSSGTGSDNNSITILNPYTLEPDAEFECSYIGETKYEALLIHLVKYHLPKAVLCIERNSVGDGIVDHLMNSEIRNNLYFDKNRDYLEEKMNKNESVESILKKQAKMKTYVGVWTGTQSREDMISILARHVNEYKEKFITHNIIRDLCRLIRKPTGKIEAGPGFHDDSIMSYLMALYVYYHGNNLLAFGIVKGLKDEDIKNEGLKRLEEVDHSLLNPEVVSAIQKENELENKQKEWERAMREALKESQKQSYQIHQAGISKNLLFENTPEAVIEEEFEEGGEIELDFFNTINGF